jgi:hypothetical protein
MWAYCTKNQGWTQMLRKGRSSCYTSGICHGTLEFSIAQIMKRQVKNVTFFVGIQWRKYSILYYTWKLFLYGNHPWFLVQYAHMFFHLGVHVPFYLHFWGYIKIFGGAMYPLTLHLGYKENELHFLHARSCILYSSCHRHWIVPHRQKNILLSCLMIMTIGNLAFSSV